MTYEPLSPVGKEQMPLFDEEALGIPDYLRDEPMQWVTSIPTRRAAGGWRR
jgi:hypothetical protein